MLITNFGTIPSQGGLMLPGWNYGLKITIPANSIDADITNFPCTVIFNSSNFDFNKAKDDGSDIRFTDKLFNHYKFEKIEYSKSNQFGKFTVLVPNVSDLTDTVYYGWSGNPNAYNTSLEAGQDMTGKQITYNGNVKMAYNLTYGRRIGTFDGNGDYFSFAHSTDFEFINGDFTIERKIVFNSISSAQMIFGKYVDASNSFGLYYANTTNKLWIDITVGGSVQGSFSCNFSPSIGSQQDILIARNGSECVIIINGIKQTVTQSTAFGSNVKLTNGFNIGEYNNAYYFNGYDLGIRITKGRARQTSNYTPPTQFEIDGTDVVCCTNFDTIYDQNYTMIQHMGDTLVDATGNGNNGTGTATIVSTEYGKARSFNGTNNKIALNNKVLTAGPKTMLLHLKPTTFTSNVIPFSNHNQSGTANGTYMRENLGKAQLLHQNNNTAVVNVISSTTISTTTDTVLGFKWDGTTTTNAVKILINGNTDAQGTATGSEGTPSQNLTFGSSGDSLLFYNGLQYEARTSNIVRSDAYVKAESKSIKNELITISNT